MHCTFHLLCASSLSSDMIDKFVRKDTSSTASSWSSLQVISSRPDDLNGLMLYSSFRIPSQLMTKGKGAMFSKVCPSIFRSRLGSVWKIVTTEVNWSCIMEVLVFESKHGPSSSGVKLLQYPESAIIYFWKDLLFFSFFTTLRIWSMCCQWAFLEWRVFTRYPATSNPGWLLLGFFLAQLYMWYFLLHCLVWFLSRWKEEAYWHYPVQYIPRNMHTILLCFALLWLCNRS